MNARLRFEGITKAFPGVKALSDVSFDVAPGEIHAFSARTAPESRRCCAFFRRVQADQRRSSRRWHEVRIQAPGACAPCRHRDDPPGTTAGADLTVAQNMFLGHSDDHRRRHAGQPPRTGTARAAEALAMIDPTINPAAPIKSLKVAQRQIVEIARALLDKAKIIAMDEPTSSLTPANSSVWPKSSKSSPHSASRSSTCPTRWTKSSVSASAPPSCATASRRDRRSQDNGPSDVIAMMVGRELHA
jgi:ribose transport system ATP-binding protein